HDIQRMGVLFAIVRQMEVNHHQTEQPDRDIQEKDHPPVKVAHDKSPGHRSEHGADQAGDGHKTHGPDQLGFGKGTHQGQPADGHHHGSAATLQNSARHQQMNI